MKIHITTCKLGTRIGFKQSLFLLGPIIFCLFFGTGLGIFLFDAEVFVCAFFDLVFVFFGFLVFVLVEFFR